MQKFWQSVKIWQSYREFKGGNFFETQRSSIINQSVNLSINQCQTKCRLPTVTAAKQWRSGHLLHESDSTTTALYNLLSGSWLTWANDTTVHYHPLPTLTDNWTRGAASRHTITPINHTRTSPCSPLQVRCCSFPIPLRVEGWVGLYLCSGQLRLQCRRMIFAVFIVKVWQ